METDRPADGAVRSRPGGGVWAVGAASFFSDVGHEMVTSVLPAFITSVLGGSAAALGIIDGVSDALAGVAKIAGGPPADDPRRRIDAPFGPHVRVYRRLCRGAGLPRRGGTTRGPRP